MSSMNLAIIIGRLTRDPELRFTATGTPVANFTVAVDRPPRKDTQEKEADFIRVTVWGKGGENCATYLGKGSQVAIKGRIQVSTYQGSDGQNKSSTEVVAEPFGVQFLDTKKRDGTSGGSTGGGSGQGRPSDDSEPEGGYDGSNFNDGFGMDEPPF